MPLPVSTIIDPSGLDTGKSAPIEAAISSSIKSTVPSQAHNAAPSFFRLCFLLSIPALHR
ncbi:hypothetical protein P029_02695 [Anaplasma phagocytophilum str. Norway variant2]|uniref:Uncharacterized protein n=1 Tax=Anaplasma phagocytophilum str. Norway variant2 TaxID=1392507 RepID=A0A168HB91_ANAPH|nr:hypothetical protein P029_02695 [Anaplasma phagocytophilum str. Norway variant2]